MLAKLNRINVKYGVAFIGVALALWIVVGVNVLLVNSVKQRLVEFGDRFTPAITEVVNADRDLYQARLAEMAFLRGIPGTPEARAHQAFYEENAVQAQERIARMAELMDGYMDTDTGGKADEYRQLYESWRRESAKVFQLYNDELVGEAMEQLDGPSQASFDALRAFYDQAGDNVAARIRALQEETLETVRLQQLAISVFAVIIGVLAIAIALIGPHLMSRAIRQITRRIREISEGDGDLTARIHSRRSDEIGELADQFNAFIGRIDGTLLKVRDSALSVKSAAEEIARGSQELSARTEQTAANLQETSASMEQITHTVHNTSDATGKATQLVGGTVEVARRGQEVMREVEQTMARINDSSTRIADIVTLIDGIAFQTNILALNASVEAARAGEHGKGFAVVAQEVRTLASRSGEASKEIRDLIGTSVNWTRSGATQVEGAGRTMEEILAAIEKVNGVIAEISTGAQEQSLGIGQVNTAVTELDTMTQHNASMVEETNAAAGEMRDQAESLSAVIGAFRLSERPSGGERTAS
ncbi:Methyl-accepting chemotaxis sensory transducer [Alloalcanivorax dieselolei B5]|uniref:Methyl-accepting chemotaxis sensory transducer n=1 Tax=Alcanivorax dieselolei (strain DSM 16502 / CGMCC 1.3690 / MCCC 1A00001 / B-5) TaxID=930169 RepID=K0C943_ALCDB|nr:methyl-accepting chemotaxis protein [Alloalcanivorax dieselolei]AFT69098.1 Methyl-accepting chemotaxis sensory transducer [Alloalcanivorax dieselolei B5]GGJ82510.1 methyl-accepting chemotaxis protein [Alloalcanivorax dieselolei]